MSGAKDPDGSSSSVRPVRLFGRRGEIATVNDIVFSCCSNNSTRTRSSLLPTPPPQDVEHDCCSNNGRFAALQLSGGAGVGKRALVETVRPVVEAQGGWLLTVPIREQRHQDNNTDNKNGDSAVETPRHCEHSASPFFALVDSIEWIVMAMNETTRNKLRENLSPQVKDVLADTVGRFAKTHARNLYALLFADDATGMTKTNSGPFETLSRHFMLPTASTTSLSNLSSSSSFLPSRPFSREQCAKSWARLLFLISTAGPLVVHFENWQWAESELDKVILPFLRYHNKVEEEEENDPSLLAAGKTTMGLVVILSYNDTLLSSGASSFLREIMHIDEPTGIAIQTDPATIRTKSHHLALSPLTWDDLYDWSCDLFGNMTDKTVEMVHAMADFAFDYTCGNPRKLKYLREYLKLDSNELLLSFNDASLESLRSELPDDIESLYKLIVLQQDTAVQSLIETSAALLLSNTGDIESRDCEMVLQQPCLDALHAATQSDLLHSEFGRIRFPNADLQRAAYSLIPLSRRSQLHLKIGRRIWANSSLGAEDESVDDGMKLPLIARQLRLGGELVQNSEERRVVAVINIRAGRKEMTASKFSSAVAYFDFAILILGEEMWKSDKYDACLSLHNSLAEALYCTGDFDRMDQILDTVLTHARSFEDELQAHTARVYSNGARHRLSVAIDAAVVVLNKLGEPLPQNPVGFTVFRELLKTRWVLRGKSDRFFLNLPLATDPLKIAAMQILTFTMHYAYPINPELGALALFRLLQLAVEHGMTEPAVTAFSVYGLLLCVKGRLEEGLRYGKIAIDLLDQFGAIAWLPRVYFAVHGLIYPWFYPLRNSLEPLKLAYGSALKTGDLEGSGLTSSTYLATAFHVGKRLCEIKHEARVHCSMLDSLGQTMGLIFILPLHNFFCELTGKSEVLPNLSGEVRDCEGAIRHAIQGGNKMALANYYGICSIKHCIMGDYRLSQAMAEKALELSKDEDYHFVFYHSLSSLAIARTRTRRHRHQLLSFGRFALKRFQRWTQRCPSNLLNKYCLLKAELASLQHKPLAAMAMFDQSIEAARAEGFVHEEGIAYERLAMYHSFLGNSQIAVPLFACARDLYQRWGADPLVRRMDQLIVEHNETIKRVN